MTTLNTIGLICPEPIMMLHQAMRKLTTGERLTLIATDPATLRDVPNFCQHLGHLLVEQAQSDKSSLPSQSDEDEFSVFYQYLIEKK